MKSVSPISRKARRIQPRWGWSGVSGQKPSDQEPHLRQLLEKLPRTKSDDAVVLAGFVELRRRFQGWLHQDEFGPTRGEQTAALRRLLGSAEKLCELLKAGQSRSRARLNAALRGESDGFSSVLETLMAATSEAEAALPSARTSDAERAWFSRLKKSAQELQKQLDLVDDATDNQITDAALLCNLEPSFPINRVTLAKAERWLRSYRDDLAKHLKH